jgi:large subunit ribosomal protein L32
MPVPKRKRSHARKHSRDANKGLDVKAVTSCKNCNAVILPHQVCKECGHYKGRKIMVTKIERAMKRGQARKSQQERSAARHQEPAVEAKSE